MIRWAVTRGNPSSVLLRDTEAKISSGIRWFSAFRGETRKSWVNHYAYLCRDGHRIVEALFLGIAAGELEKYDRSKKSWGLIVEHIGFTLEQHAVADGVALDLVGLPYNLADFVEQIPDGLLSKLLGRDVYFFRKLQLPWIRSGVCSGIGVRVHKLAGWIFMGQRTVYRKIQRGIDIRVRAVQVLTPLPAWRATPDDLWDDALEHRPALYRVVGEINPPLRPKDLPDLYAAKIEADLAR